VKTRHSRSSCSAVVAVVLAVFASSLAALIAPPDASAQQVNGLRRIGYLYGPPDSPGHVVFEEALQRLGWVKDRNIAIDYRSAKGDLERLPALAAELVALRVELIVATTAAETSAARRATRNIPIVFVAHGDPVRTGDVASLAHPGGNVTGFSQAHPDLSGKQLQLLKELVPEIRRIAVLWNATVPAKDDDWRALRPAAQAEGIALQSRELRSQTDLAGALASIKKDRPDALLILGDPLLFTLRKEIADFAIGQRLPTMYPWQSGVSAGGLVSYSADLNDLFRRAAGYVDEILRGATPSQLPVQQPLKFELTVNLKTARALGISVPQAVLLQADRMIE
jgi:putative ABC transport system substrate-binding protein